MNKILKEIAERVAREEQQEQVQKRKNYLVAMNDPEFAAVDKRYRALVSKGESAELEAVTAEREKLFSKWHKTTKKSAKSAMQEHRERMLNSGVLFGVKHSAFNDGLLTPFNGISTRERYKKVFTTLASYCEKFPTLNRPNVVLYGPAGTGKTYAAKVLARSIICKNYHVIFKSAFELVQIFKDYIWKDSDELQELLECDLLVIDDLGVEPTLRNVTQEYLYNIINQRLEYRKPFVITTNLDKANLVDRYGQAIAGRILSKETSLVIKMDCEDLRG